MGAMFSLLFGYLKKSFHSIFFGFIFPIIMLVILVAIATKFIFTCNLAMTYSDFKQSIIIKRIGATPLKSWQFITTIIIFHVIFNFYW